MNNEPILTIEDRVFLFLLGKNGVRELRPRAHEIPYNLHLDRWQTEPPDPYRHVLERFGKGGFGS